MSRNHSYDVDPANVDVNGCCEAQQLATSGNLILNGDQADTGLAARWDIGDSYPSGIEGARFAFSIATDGLNWTVTGKDQDGQSITDVVAGNNGGVSETTKYFSQITQVAGSGQCVANLTLGPVDEVVTKTYPLNWRSSDPATYIIHDPVGTFSVIIEEYWADPQSQPLATDGWTAVGTTSVNTATEGNLHARAVRVRTLSYTDGAEFQFLVLQSTVR